MKLTIGKQMQHKTYNANHLYDETGRAIAMIYGIPDNIAVDDLDPAELTTAAEIVRAVNAFPELLDLLRDAYDRFTDADFVPANHELKSWLDKTVTLLKAKP